MHANVRGRHAPDRRSFLRAAGAAALPAWLAAELRAPAGAGATAAKGERPRVALVGCGGRGRGIAKDAARFADVVAVCDVDAKHAGEAAREHDGAEVYNDFRKLLERKDVDAVLNATPDHWHTLVNLAAIRAGKDVYSEKPLTRTVDEGKRLVNAVRPSGRILQTGSQQRSDPHFRLACEVVRNGRLGKLTQVTTVLPAGPRRGPFKAAAVPGRLDWDFWQGPAPAHDYVPERCHFWFRYWLDYSGGTLTDWGAHHNDIALWALGRDRSGPVTIEGRATVEQIPGGFTAPAEYEVEYTYADGVRHRCVSTTADTLYGTRARDLKPGELANGVKFEGPGGWLCVSRGKIEASRPELLNDRFGPKDVRLPVSNDHMGNFFECVRVRKPPVCDAEVGHRAASVCHLGGIAIRLGRKLRWDPAKEEFVDDREANRHLAREMRKPWTYDGI
jgi:predicted dehydrogenase